MAPNKGSPPERGPAGFEGAARLGVQEDGGTAAGTVIAVVSGEGHGDE